jgi:predicted permease
VAASENGVVRRVVPQRIFSLCLFLSDQWQGKTKAFFVTGPFIFSFWNVNSQADAFHAHYMRRSTMKTLEKVSNFVGKWMALIVLVVAALALFAPATCSWIKTSWINTLLGVVMFGMGLTLKASDFAEVFKRPKDVILGAVCQFTLMPLLAFLLTKLFRLSPELAVGVILVGTCPGGTSSNVMTYLSHGDVPLSVSMTAVSTILAPVMTPLLTLLYAGQTVDVNVVAMFLSVVKTICNDLRFVGSWIYLYTTSRQRQMVTGITAYKWRSSNEV